VPRRRDPLRTRRGETFEDSPPVEELPSEHRSPARPRHSLEHALLGELLVRSELITDAQLADALGRQPSTGQRIGSLLVELGALTEHDLTEVLSRQLHVPVIDLAQQMIASEAVDLLPESVAKSHQAIPVALEEDRLTIAVSDPSPELESALETAARRPVRLAIAPPADIQQAINRAYRALGEVQRHVDAFEATEGGRHPSQEYTTVTTADDAPVVQVVNLILTQALRDRASDIHIEPQGSRVRVRYRIDGALHDAIDPLPASIAPALTSRIKILAGMNIVERRRPQDGQISMEIDNRPIDIRVSTVATIWGETCVMRLLDKSRSLFRMSELGMPDDTHDIFGRLIQAPFGMVLSAGPTGSGKTTTLYAALSEIDEPRRNIMTIEDPVEYVFPTINQIQTNEQAGITFATGLRSILRQDPDVILVGEIRDVDTARIAVQSALTGHFVLSSLPATDCAAALHRFLDMGIESFLIASSVLAVVSQRLVRRICQSCMEPYEPKDEELAFYGESGGEPKSKFWRGQGCNFCAGTGYRDRIGVYEIMRITPEIKRLIVGWATQDEIQRMAVNQGMRPLRDEAINLISNDITTISEVVRSIYAA
jgi:type IV pilus assembly protein PilB